MRPVSKATIVVIAAAITLSVTACGTPAPPTASPTTAVAIKTATPTDTPTGAGVAIKSSPKNPLGIDWAKQAPFTGPAADQFGAANVMAAYEHAVEFSLQQGYSNLMAKGFDARPVEFSFVTPYLTPSAKKAWNASVKAALSSPENVKDANSIFILTTWGLLEDGQKTYVFRDGQHLYTLGRSFSPATATVLDSDKGQVLSLHFSVSRDVRVMKDGKAVLMPVAKDITYEMVPNGLKGIPWLIDSWKIVVTPALDKIVSDPIGAKD